MGLNPKRLKSEQLFKFKKKKNNICLTALMNFPMNNLKNTSKEQYNLLKNIPKDLPDYIDPPENSTPTEILSITPKPNFPQKTYQPQNIK